MASGDHQILSQFLKEVHSNLRKNAAKLGPEKAWQAHCQNTNTLTKYAKYMQKLATTHWESNCASETSEATSRIEWAANICVNYFFEHNYLKHREKEINIAEKIGISLQHEENYPEVLKLIDIGSCYNPFSRYNFFDVTAIDLCPANDSVYQCDFLNVQIGTRTLLEGCNALQLQELNFDVVTFCFLLEYIPSSQLRISACEKAYSLLKPGGLLIINTPDSKHVGANFKIMKCWRYALALIGFNRIKYEKFRHMHCMAFRKSLHKDIPKRWAELHKENFMDYSIQIPQDLLNIPVRVEEQSYQPSVTDFKEMPFHDEITIYTDVN